MSFGKVVILFVLCFVGNSCINKQKLKNPDSLFSEQELSELNSLVCEFDELLIKKYDSKDAASAYLKYSKHNWDKLKENSSIAYLREIDTLYYEVIDFQICNQIWEIDTLNRSIKYFKTKGKYFEFLKLIGKEYEIINKYVIEVSEMGDISPNLITMFAAEIELDALRSKNVRLIFAIHYLTLYQRS